MFTEKSNPIISCITIISAVITVSYFLVVSRTSNGEPKCTGFSSAFIKIGLCRGQVVPVGVVVKWKRLPHSCSITLRLHSLRRTSTGGTGKGLLCHRPRLKPPCFAPGCIVPQSCHCWEDSLAQTLVLPKLVEPQMLLGLISIAK